jgi:branched-subunit amino acid ABC-type transport system permease component
MDILPQLIINSLIAGSFYALLAMSFNLIFGATKFFNFAHGAFAVIGAYTTFYLKIQLGLNSILAVILGIISAGIFALIFEKLIFFRLRQKKSKPLIVLVASIGLFSLIQAVIAILFTSQFKTLNPPANSPKIFTLLNGTFTDLQLLLFATTVLVFFGFICLFRFTRFGQAITALSDDEEVAKIVGINTNQIIAGVFMLGASISGMVGIFIGHDTGIEPIMGLNLLLKGIIAAIIGGLGTVTGGFLGGFLLGLVENFGIWKISGEWKDAIAFGLLIIFLLFRPQGIIKK